MLKLSSERLCFRTLAQSDVTAAYAAWLSDPLVNRYLETRHAKQDLESCAEFVRSMNESGTEHLFGIFLIADGQHIGNIKLGALDRRYSTGELSLLIGERSAWGQGFATEAIRRIARFGFDDLGLERIEAGCYEDNLGSLRAFLKAGFTVEGFLRKKFVSEGKRTGCFCLGALKGEVPGE